MACRTYQRHEYGERGACALPTLVALGTSMDSPGRDLGVRGTAVVRRFSSILRRQTGGPPGSPVCCLFSQSRQIPIAGRAKTCDNRGDEGKENGRWAYETNCIGYSLATWNAGRPPCPRLFCIRPASIRALAGWTTGTPSWIRTSWSGSGGITIYRKQAVFPLEEQEARCWTPRATWISPRR